ncbi:MAG: hypothetical protein A2W23_03360 [Planctomycetes bacterium RBG_16_43_13]|nr:MAG: hypothetical protein A2W23_03360 [Planctomycetes bacterium RBG_16_43_13]
MVEKGQFRRDLFYRLNVVMINVPPLRERKDDIPLLVEYFIGRNNRKSGRAVRGVSKDALYTLLRYDWSGNVRELEHTVEHAFALGKGDLIDVADIPASIIKFVEEKSNRAITIPANKQLGEIEKDLIVKALIECKGDTAKASKLLGIDRSTVYRKLKRSGIDLDNIKNSMTTGSPS